MRFNLKVPFAEKDTAKALGARWDAARKIWYVTDPRALSDFSAWMPQSEPPSAGAATVSVPVAAPSHAGVFTDPARVQSLCDCAVLPWEHCAHSRPGA